MAEKKARAKKPQVKRKSPNRTGGLFANSRDRTAESGNSSNDPVMQVYKVMEEQLRAGAMGAQSLWSSAPGFNAMPGNGNPNAMFDMWSQWMDMYIKMMSMGFGMFESMADMRNGGSGFPFPDKDPGSSAKNDEGDKADDSDPLPVSIRMHSKVPAEVSIDLRVTGSDECHVQPLQNIAGGKTSIKNVQLQIIDDVRTLTLSIPKSCKKGTYVGAIINTAENTGCGTVTVTV